MAVNPSSCLRRVSDPRGFSRFDCIGQESVAEDFLLCGRALGWLLGAGSACFRETDLETQPRNPQPRYLGLDVGNRRIGVAVSDELGLTAQPVMTLERRRAAPGISRDDLRSLARLARRFGVVGIVVGNPVHLSGEVSTQAAKTQAFAAVLGELSGLPIHLWDERLTTREAHQILYEAGHARQEHRRVVDQVAATLILQSFLEAGTGGLRD